MNTAILEHVMTLQLKSAAQTDRGQRRKLNEDAVFQRTDHVDVGHSVGLYLVCDGVGGHQAGEVASRLAIETVTAELAQIFPLPRTRSSNPSYYAQPSYSTLRQQIQASIARAHAEIRHYAQTRPQEAADLATTITLALIYGNRAYIANVGDSRTYVWRHGQLTQITRDHSLAALLAERGQIDEAAILDHPRSNVLYQALGIHEKLDVDLFEWDLQPGDKLLLCSDGLWRAFPDTAELARWLNSTATPDALCQRLVTEASQRDGSDNISAVVVSVNQSPQERG
jgi:serine/threonine protein phosphatase PrpC